MKEKMKTENIKRKGRINGEKNERKGKQCMDYAFSFMVV